MLGTLHASTGQAEGAAWPAANIPVPVGYFTDIYEVARSENYSRLCRQVQVIKFQKYLMWDLRKYEMQKRQTSVRDVEISQEEPRGRRAQEAGPTTQDVTIRRPSPICDTGQ